MAHLISQLTTVTHTQGGGYQTPIQPTVWRQTFFLLVWIGSARKGHHCLWLYNLLHKENKRSFALLTDMVGGARGIMLSYKASVKLSGNLPLPPLRLFIPKCWCVADLLTVLNWRTSSFSHVCYVTFHICSCLLAVFWNRHWPEPLSPGSTPSQRAKIHRHNKLFVCLPSN